MKLTTTTLEEVIEVLINKYPNRLPKESVGIDELNRLIGQQDVIVYLVGLLESLERKKNAS